MRSVVILFIAVGVLYAEPVLPPPSKDAVSFTKDVWPLLEAKCVKCHNADKRKGGFALSDGPSALAGADTGKVILPGNSAKSRLVHVVTGLDADSKMPPEGLALTAAEVGRIRKWIDDGAVWDANIKYLGGAKSSHWAFQPITAPKMPSVKNTTWVRNPIDAFVLARLEREGLTPAPEASKETLLRRVTLDLTGLLPTPQEVDDFLKDTSADAYAKVVARLLASPHYGERWGRHWLDAARYADSDGYEKDTGRPWAWRYRDWVINAFNRDQPFDRFTIDQLAGDLLPGATTEQRIATGFHRNTLTNKEGGVDQEEFRVAAVVDRVNTTSKVWLGLTMNCCQCHDHKYDPLAQREYYQMFAFFNSDQETDIDAPLADEAKQLAERSANHAKRRTQLVANLSAYEKTLPELQAKWEAAQKLDDPKLPKPVAEALAATPRTPAQAKLIADHYAKSDTKLTQLKNAITNHDKTKPTVSKAPALKLGTERKTHVMIRGDFLRSGVEVAPSTLRVLPALPTKAKPTRLDLAQWLVDPANPLTRRVLANWIWHKYFGRGIVATVDDFGTQGEKPSHPELLDWLATQLLERKWSLKEFHTLLVTSATYRQASAHRPDVFKRDPQNVLLAKQNRVRLEAEIVRDVTLTASGLLTRTVGGPSIRPPQPAGIAELTYAGSAKWVESTGADRYRRGLYIWFQRTSPYPTLMTFDTPDSNVCTVRRERSNTPLQALTLLNDIVFVECAQAFGHTLAAQPGDVATKFDHAFRTCFARLPSTAERERLHQLLADLRASAKAKPDEAAKLLGKNPPKGDVVEQAAWIALARVLFNLDEMVTRE